MRPYLSRQPIPFRAKHRHRHIGTSTSTSSYRLMPPPTMVPNRQYLPPTCHAVGDVYVLSYCRYIIYVQAHEAHSQRTDEVCHTLMPVCVMLRCDSPAYEKFKSSAEANGDAVFVEGWLDVTRRIRSYILHSYNACTSKRSLINVA